MIPNKVSACRLPTSLYHGSCYCHGSGMLEGNKMDSPMHTGTVSVPLMYVLPSVGVYVLLLLLSQSSCLLFVHVPCNMVFVIVTEHVYWDACKALSLWIGARKLCFGSKF